MSQRCQRTKSLRSSPLRGSKSRETGSRSREDSDSLVIRRSVISLALPSGRLIAVRLQILEDLSLRRPILKSWKSSAYSASSL